MSVFFTRRGAPPSLGKQLSDYVEGDIVKISENGTPVEFYVAKHDYESGLNGAGRTLVVRKDCYGEQEWDSGNVNAYASSTIDSWFNGTYKNLLDADIRALIGTTKILYTPGNSNNTVGTLERAIFALSLTELGQSNRYANTEGFPLPIASTLRITTTDWWLRSPYTSGIHYVWGLFSDGDIIYDFCYYPLGARPAFTLPSTTKFDPDTNIIIG